MAIFYVTYILFVAMVLLNVVIAVLLGKFGQASADVSVYFFFFFPFYPPPVRGHGSAECSHRCVAFQVWEGVCCRVGIFFFLFFFFFLLCVISVPLDNVGLPCRYFFSLFFFIFFFSFFPSL